MTFTFYGAYIYSDHWTPESDILPLKSGIFDKKEDAEWYIRDTLTRCPYLIAFIEEDTNVNGQIYIKRERRTL